MAAKEPFSRLPLPQFVREALRSLVCEQPGFAACDGVRGLAMLWVCIFHAVSHYLWGLSAGTSDIGSRLFSRWWPIAMPMSGDCGVDMFLVLSGFLLGGALFCEMSASGSSPGLCKFFLRRWLRISPAYIFAMVLGVALDMPGGSRAGCQKHWWSNMLFINNIYPAWDPMWGPSLCMVHSWSVAVEVQLYLITPPLFMLARFICLKIKQVSLACSVIALCVFLWTLCSAWRFYYVITDPKLDYAPPYVYTWHRMAPYLAGIIAGVAVRHWDKQLSTGGGCSVQMLRAVLGFLSVALIAAASVFGGTPRYFILQSQPGGWYGHELRVLALLHASFLRPFFGAAVAFLLVLAVTGGAPLLNRMLGAPFWRPIAGLSYSMYLLQYVGWDVLFVRWFETWPAAHLDTSVPLGTLQVYFGALLALLGIAPLAFLSYVFVEYPGMLLGKYLVSLPCMQQRSLSAKPVANADYGVIAALARSDPLPAADGNPDLDLETGQMQSEPLPRILGLNFEQKNHFAKLNVCSSPTDPEVGDETGADEHACDVVTNPAVQEE